MQFDQVIELPKMCTTSTGGPDGLFSFFVIGAFSLSWSVFLQIYFSFYIFVIRDHGNLFSVNRDWQKNQLVNRDETPPPSGPSIMCSDS